MLEFPIRRRAGTGYGKERSEMNSAESQLEMGHKIQRSDATSVMRPVGSESKREPNTTTASQAESLLAAEKRTLEMMANGPPFRGPERFVCLH